MSFLRTAGRITTGYLLPRRAYPVLRGPLKGLRFVLGAFAGEGGGASVYLNMMEPGQTAEVARVIKPGYVFFDVGANAGYYTLLGSRQVGASGFVLSFEPAIRNISWLHRHLAVNKAGNVSVVAAACSDVATLSSFSEGPNCAEGHLDPGAPVGELSPGTWTLVSTVTLDQVAEYIGKYPDVIKIDVEGAELDVLHGAENILKTKHPQIFLSIHSDELRTTCLAYLEGFGYKASALVPDDPKPTEYLLS
jgi:FkbM family methyltransferase